VHVSSFALVRICSALLLLLRYLFLVSFLNFACRSVAFVRGQKFNQSRIVMTRYQDFNFDTTSNDMLQNIAISIF